MYRCPRCHQLISLADVNFSRDIAVCRHCGQTSTSWEVLENQGKTKIDLAHPPMGAYVRDAADHFEVGVSYRSWPAFCLFFPFALFCWWHLLTVVYGWLSQARRFEWGSVAPYLGFLLLTSVLTWLCLITAAGRVAVRLEQQRGVIFYGAGRLGKRQRFQVQEFSAISYGEVLCNDDCQTVRELRLVTPAKTLTFGHGLTEAQQDFVAAALRVRLRLG